MAAHPLFQGATFNAGYNANRSAMRVATPSGLRRAVLAALITGTASADFTSTQSCVLYSKLCRRTIGLQSITRFEIK